MVDLKARMVRPRIGLLPTGHLIYWGQFPGLKEMGLNMYEKYRQRLGQIGEVISPGLVDTKENPETSLPAIMQNMRRFSVRCLPVMDQKGKVRGLVTAFDIFKALLKLKSSPDISTALKSLQRLPSSNVVSAASVMHREYITPTVPTPSSF